jgi:hypothetical protein
LRVSRSAHSLTIIDVLTIISDVLSALVIDRPEPGPRMQVLL